MFSGLGLEPRPSPQRCLQCSKILDHSFRMVKIKDHVPERFWQLQESLGSMLQTELLGEVRRSDKEPAVQELTGLAVGNALRCTCFAVCNLRVLLRGSLA